MKIGTRGSPLALIQAGLARDALALAHGIDPAAIAIVAITTTGDRERNRSLAEIGGKGLFIKEIEDTLLERRADLAVHSLKDMTSVIPEELCLAAVPEREDPRDALVSPSRVRLRDLPPNAAVGTSSLRRQCQLLERRPDLKIVHLRGNVETRLRKMREQNLAGVVLAAAGLHRLDLAEEITEVLEPEVSLPAVGQGALAIECRRDDEEVLSLVAPLEHAPTRATTAAERAFLAELQGGCRVPIAGHATLVEGTLRLRGLVGSPDGAKVVRGERSGPSDSGAVLGKALAAQIAAAGGREILAALGGTPPVGGA